MAIARDIRRISHQSKFTLCSLDLSLTVPLTLYSPFSRSVLISHVGMNWWSVSAKTRVLATTQFCLLLTKDFG